MSNQSHSVSAAAARFSMHALTGGGVLPPASSPTNSNPVASTPTGEDGGGSIPRVQPSPVYIDRLRMSDFSDDEWWVLLVLTAHSNRLSADRLERECGVSNLADLVGGVQRKVAGSNLCLALRADEYSLEAHNG